MSEEPSTVSASATVVPATGIPDEKVDMPLQSWQIRRMELFRVMKVLAQDPKDVAAKYTLDVILTEYEYNLGDRTPIEGMDLLGMWYLRRESIEMVMPAIVEEAVLGWADALQWASESAKAEIVNNEGFFKRAALLCGRKEVGAEWTALVKDNPDKARAIVEAGIGRANQLRISGKLGYDHKWVTAYGLERVMNGSNDQSGPAASPTPRLSDDAAWQEAVTRVRSYYLPNL